MAGFSMEEHKQRQKQLGMLLGAPFTNMDYSMDKYLHWLYKVWDEIIYSFPNFNGETVGSLGMGK